MELSLNTKRLVVDENGIAGFFWPLTRAEQQIQRDVMLERLAALIQNGLGNGDDDSRLLSMGMHWFLGESVALFRATAVTRRAGNAGAHLCFPEESRVYRSVAESSVPDATKGRFADLLRAGPEGHGFFLSPLVKWRRSLAWNGPSLGALLPIDFDNEVTACHRTPLLDAHARAEQRLVKQTLLDEWFSPIYEEPKTKPINGSLMDKCIDAIAQSYLMGGEILPPSQESYYRDFISFITRYIRHHYEPLGARRRLPDTLWTGSGGYLYARMLRNAVQARGGYVVGHEHGAGEAHIAYFSAKTVIEYESADEFVTYCWDGADALSATFNPAWHVRGGKPKIVSIGERTHESLSESPRQMSKYPGSMRRVMYPSTALLGERVTIDHFIGDYVLIDWAARLMSQLRKMGYQVLHKPHPEGDNRHPDHWFKRLGIEQLNAPFEKVQDQADLFVLDFSRSSTFPFALATDKPIVFIDFGLERWHAPARELLERRVRVVPGTIDSHNRFIVDWDELEKAIPEACERMDRTIVKRYYPHFWNEDLA